MSLNHQIQHDCPHCGSTQAFNHYGSVNVTIQPELKNKVLNGTLNSQNCTNCNEDVNIVSGFLYHDMEQQFMLSLNQAEEDEKEDSKSEMIEQLIHKGYIYREVTSYPEIIEKIRIFDSKLNDEVIEKVKATVTVMLKDSLKEVIGEIAESVIHVFFSKLEKGLFKTNLTFTFFLDPSQMMQMKYNIKELEPADKRRLFDVDSLRN